MSTAIVIDSYEIRQIQQRKISPSSKFDALTTKIRRLSSKVKQEWDNFSAEDQEALKELAYTLIEPPSGGLLGLKDRIRAKINLWFIKATNQTEAFEALVQALDALVDTILDAVERQDPSYQSVLSDTLEQLYSGAVQSKELKPEETRGWLRSISDSAVGEV